MRHGTLFPPAFAESRLMPSRGAAAALLALDAALLFGAAMLPSHTWVVLAYVPLLITVVLGAIMSGRWRLATASGSMVIAAATAALWLCVTFDRWDYLGTVLSAGKVLIGTVVLVWLALAAWGWCRFFAATKPA